MDEDNLKPLNYAPPSTEPAEDWRTSLPGWVWALLFAAVIFPALALLGHLFLGILDDS